LFQSAAFAPPLLDLTSEPSGGLHLHGGSQTGKTTALCCGASVWGRADTSGQIRTWRATGNGMEGVAAETCDALLPLDEIGMVDAREAGEIVYSLANESGKARAGRDGSARARRTWRTVFLSTGEVPLSVKMGESGAATRAGQEVRLANIPADAGAGLGVFQKLHGKADGTALAVHLREAGRSYYGTAARQPAS
jgi:putative DNA primase/helicase